LRSLSGKPKDKPSTKGKYHLIGMRMMIGEKVHNHL